jgi:hypothetical protein
LTARRIEIFAYGETHAMIVSPSDLDRENIPSSTSLKLHRVLQSSWGKSQAFFLTKLFKLFDSGVEVV